MPAPDSHDETGTALVTHDRGPHRGGKRRLIGLPAAAAKRVSLTSRGVDLVRVVVIKDLSGGLSPCCVTATLAGVDLTARVAAVHRHPRGVVEP